jgi:peptide chain release factor subunit 1
MSSDSSNSSDVNGNADDPQVSIWKVKQLIKKLQSAKGNDTSLISLVIPPRDQIAQVSKMLAEEYGKAANIKSRVNRLSVLSAITSTQQKLKLYSRVPDNGLILYCGNVVGDDGKEKKVNIDFEPFKAIRTSLYICGNTFHTEVLGGILRWKHEFVDDVFINNDIEDAAIEDGGAFNEDIW